MRSTRRLSRPGPRGLSLVEAVLSLVVVSILLTAALTTVSSARMGQFKTGLSSRGQLLAEALMAEILQQAYQDPTGPVLFGREAGEASTPRSGYDDVDDYNGWTSSPLFQKDGSAIAGTAGWRHTVTVHRVNPADLTSVVQTESHVKRITVKILFKDVEVAVLTAVKTTGEAY